MRQYPADTDGREEQVARGLRFSEVRIQLHGKLCNGFLQHGFPSATVFIQAGLPFFSEAVARERSSRRRNWKKVWQTVKMYINVVSTFHNKTSAWIRN